VKILLVEDNSDDAEFLRACLAHSNRAATLTRAGLIKDAVTALEKERFDVVLLDLNLPDGRGVECVERLREADDLTPIVVLSGQGDEDFAVDILNRGVQDYLVKWEGDGRIILRAIRYAIERKRAEIKLNYLARLDSVTNLPNRFYIRDKLAQVAKRVARRRGTMSLLLMDLDGFKSVNETLGHATGDALLRAVADRLKAGIPEGDLVARIGGDEFAVVLEDVDSPREVEGLARKITGLFQQPFQVGERLLSITPSMGITVCPPDSIDSVEVLKTAERALSEAKQQGKKTFRFFTPTMHEEILSAYRLDAGLKAALKQEQFVLLYQPQVRLADHRIEAVEALLHWRHPERGLLNPGEFMSAAEASDCIMPIGMWAIEQVCRQLGHWESAGAPVPRVAVNVAAAQLRQPEFSDALRSVLQAHSVDPELIELEFTERALMDDAGGTRERLWALRDVGVRLAIDDFAARDLSLGELRQLPLDVLKVGPSFVSDLDTSKDAQAVCGAIVSIAHGFLLDAVANGVSSERQEAFLTKHHCLYGQGDHYGAAMQPEQVASKMAESGGQVTRRRRVPRKRTALKAG